MKQLLILLTLFVGLQGYSQTNVYQETFETDANGTNYNTSIDEFSDGSTDYFTRTDGSDIAGSVQINGVEGSFFFGAQDIDGEGATLPVTLSTAQIDVSGFSNLDLAVLLAEDSDLPDLDWDDDDYVHFTYTLDGGAPQDLLWVESTGSGFNNEAAIDTDFDGVGDGTVLTENLSEFTAPIDVSGASNLEIQIEFQLDSGDEDIAIDNLRVVDGFTASPSLTVTNPSDGETFVPGTTQVDVEFNTANTSASDQVNIDVNGNVTQDISSPFPIQTADGQSYSVTLDLVSGGNVVDSESLTFDIATATQVPDVATLRNGAQDGTLYELTGEALLTYQQGFRNQKYIEDATAGILIDDLAGNITTTYDVGDGITGLIGEVTEFAGVIQFIPLGDPGAASSTNNTITPQVITINEFNTNFEDYESELVAFEDVTFTTADGTLTFSNGDTYPIEDVNANSTLVEALFNMAYTDTTVPTNTVNVAGLASEDSGELRILPRDNDIDITLSTDAFQNIDVNIYPNPVSNGQITIDHQLNGDVELTLYTISGKKVMNQQIGENDKLDVSGLNSGVYLLQLVNGSTKATEKIIVK